MWDLPEGDSACIIYSLEGTTSVDWAVGMGWVPGGGGVGACLLGENSGPVYVEQQTKQFSFRGTIIRMHFVTRIDGITTQDLELSSKEK